MGEMLLLLHRIVTQIDKEDVEYNNVVWVGQMLPQMSIGGGGRGDMLTIILGEEVGPLMLWRPGKRKKMLEMLKMESEDPHVLT